MNTIHIPLLILSCLLTIACHQKKENTNTLVLAAASSMQFVMYDLMESYTEKTGVKCELILGSSGKLTAQIKAGAPYDLFLSADMKYPREVFNRGFADTLPRPYAYGQLVLWTAKEHISPAVELLTSESINHIAIANPAIAPYGAAAIDVISYYDLFAQVEEKLVYGESIAQTNQFIVSKSAELGFTAMSVVLSSRMKETGSWIPLDTVSYRPIEQGVVVLKRGEKVNANAKTFSQFLFSDEAKKILEDFGYLVYE